MIKNHFVPERMNVLQTKLSGIPINYIAEGLQNDCEEAIVLLHGWGSNIALFRQMVSHLSQYWRVYALDMPGFGESGEPKTPWSVDDFADCVLQFIEFCGIKKAVLLGHSHGGRVSIKIANRKDLPFELTKLILVDSAGILPRKTIKKRFRQRCYKIGRTVLSIGAIQKMFPDALENLRNKHGSADYKSATPLMRQSLVKVVNEDLEPLLPNIKQPTLLIWGEDDTATPLSDGKRMEELIPDAGLVTIKNAGHYSFLDQWGTVRRVLDSFLGIPLNS